MCVEYHQTTTFVLYAKRKLWFQTENCRHYFRSKKSTSKHFRRRNLYHNVTKDQRKGHSGLRSQCDIEITNCFSIIKSSVKGELPLIHNLLPNAFMNTIQRITDSSFNLLTPALCYKFYTHCYANLVHALEAGKFKN